MPSGSLAAASCSASRTATAFTGLSVAGEASGVAPAYCVTTPVQLPPPFAHTAARALPPAGGQSELEASLNLNAMNKTPNPWHVSFSYARALQNTVLKTWQGQPGNVAAAQQALLRRAKARAPPACPALPCP